MNHAVLQVTPSERCSWWLLIPFLEEQSRKVANHHFVKGTLERSKTLPTVTVN